MNEKTSKILEEYCGLCLHEWVYTDGDATWHRCTKCQKAIGGQDDYL